jgi:glycerol-3-phosphate acyltransferase PlsX
MKKIVIDIYGADNGPAPIIEGALKAVKNYKDFGIIFVGSTGLIEEELKKYDEVIDGDKISVIDTSDYITNNDPPPCVLRDRDDSSMVKSLLKLKEDDSCVGMLCAGNTGALFVGSIFKLGLLPGIKTPALSCEVADMTGKRICLLDCGANIECEVKDFAKFALFGDAFMKSVYNIENPRVGLLSVGRESKKGTNKILEAHEMLKTLPINFIGNVEGSDIVTGFADVIVADGFSGNILLKSIESAGLAARETILKTAKDMGDENSPLIKEISNAIYKNFALNDQGGAVFLGTKKAIVKMHGCANSNTAVACVDLLIRLNKAGFDKYLNDAVEKIPK